ncbi:MAG: hypothetical protein KJO09_11770 [Gammaproteobacteria bacterium]|nr:hypothetical protein [Gammaproteobacteria bacterium]
MPLLSTEPRSGQNVNMQRRRLSRKRLSRCARWENCRPHRRTSSGRLFYNYYRTYDPSTGRYLESDPIGLQGGLNTYGYVYQNPLRWIDPLGLDVTINIIRTGHTSNSNTGVITATSDVTGDSYVGDFLENRNPPNPNLPTPPGSYKAFVDKRQGRKDRVELLNVPNATDIQIHVGNSLADLEGCFAPGTATGTPDWVSNSGVAMDKILDIIANDGTGNIDVTIYNNDPNP